MYIRVFFYTHLVHPEANREPHSIRIPPTRASGTLTPETFPIDEESPADITAPPVTPITSNTYKITEKETRILILFVISETYKFSTETDKTTLLVKTLNLSMHLQRTTFLP